MRILYTVECDAADLGIYVDIRLSYKNANRLLRFVQNNDCFNRFAYLSILWSVSTCSRFLGACSKSFMINTPSILPVPDQERTV
jgi:hypothetical protein